jgi:protein TonB
VKRTKKWSFSKSFLVSMVLHASLLLATFIPLPHLLEDSRPEVVQIDYVPPTPDTVSVPPDLQKKKPVVIEKHQIVDQSEKALNDEVPTEQRFLSVHNQVVKKQTIAKNHGEFKNSKMPAAQSGDGGQPESKPLTVEDLKPKFDISKTIQNRLEAEKDREQQSEKDALKKYEERKAQKIANDKTHRPASADKPGETGADASQSLDYIKDLDPGLETLLSTKEFVYYTYYARIRRQLNQYWGPKVREKLTKLYRQGRSIASADDKVTKLLISLDRQGNLVKVQIIGNSGVHDLDEAAVESFRAAAPFPNPPGGMVDPDGQIKIRWDFILEG